MRPLYEISNDYQRLLWQMQSGKEEDIIQACDDLETIKSELEEKVYNCVAILKTLESEYEAIDIEIERLKSRSKSLERQAQWMQKYITNCLQNQPFKAKIFSLSFRHTKAVEIIGEVPEQYLRTKTISEPDKILIKKDIECGAEIPGAVLKDNYSLQIK